MIFHFEHIHTSIFLDIQTDTLIHCQYLIHTNSIAFCLTHKHILYWIDGMFILCLWNKNVAFFRFFIIIYAQCILYIVITHNRLYQFQTEHWTVLPTLWLGFSTISHEIDNFSAKNQIDSIFYLKYDFRMPEKWQRRSTRVFYIWSNIT